MKYLPRFYLPILVLTLLFYTKHNRAATNNTGPTSDITAEELVIPFDGGKSGIKIATGLVIGSASLFALSSLLLFATRSSKLFYLFLATELITGCFLASSVSGYKRAVSKDPIAILNKEGIWISSCGNIAWHDIEEIGMIQGPSTFAKALGIKIKEDSLPAIQSQSSLRGKIGLAWSHLLCSQCHIFLPSASIPVEEIISFAKRFIT